MADVTWNTRKVGNWSYDDGRDVHEFEHTLIVNGQRFKLREGDMFDVGPYLRFDLIPLL